MSELKRYRLAIDANGFKFIEENEYGDWVRYEDAAKIIAERDDLKIRLERAIQQRDEWMAEYAKVMKA